jgi:hypothetical protein
MSLESPGIDLTLLIHALKSKEKRYFRLYTGRNGHVEDRNYMQLYTHLQTQATWSEAQVRTTFEGAPFLKQLNVACSYLYELLLAALRGYDQDKTFHSEAHRRLDEVVLLFQRKLYGPCFRRIRLGLRFATQLDLPQLQLEFLQWEVRLLRQFPGKHQWQRTEAALTRSGEVMRQLGLENELYAIYSRLFLLVTRPSAETRPDSKQQIQATALDPLLRTRPMGLAFDAQLLYHLIHSLLAHSAEDGQAYAQAYADMLECWELHPQRITAEQERYLKTLTGYVDSALRVEDLTPVPAALAKMRRLCGRSPALESSSGLLVRHLELHYLMTMQAFGKAVQLSQDIHDYLLKKEGPKLSAGHIAICTNAALAHFIMESWNGCLDWLSRIEPFLKGGLRKDVALWVGPVRIVALYAANRLDELEKVVRTWRRNADAGLLAPVLADGFTTLNRCNSDSEERAALEQLKQAVREIRAQAPSLELVENWIMARLKQVPLRNFYAAKPQP